MQNAMWQAGYGPTNPSLVDGTGELRQKKGRMPQYQCRFGRHRPLVWEGFVDLAEKDPANCERDAACKARATHATAQAALVFRPPRTSFPGAFFLAPTLLRPF